MIGNLSYITLGVSSIIHFSSEGAIPTNTSTTVKMNPTYKEVHMAPDVDGCSLLIAVEAKLRNEVADGVLLVHEQSAPYNTGLADKYVHIGTAFYNGNIPPVERKGIETRDLSATAQTINQGGVTIVPLDVKALEDSAIYIRAKDPAYANPGPDEVQQFAK